VIQFWNTLGLLAFALVALFCFTLVNCTFWETMRYNSDNRDSAYNSFQFAQGWQCTRSVWSSYTLGILPP
jgi:hypothetical protein